MKINKESVKNCIALTMVFGTTATGILLTLFLIILYVHFIVFFSLFCAAMFLILLWWSIDRTDKIYTLKRIKKRREEIWTKNQIN